MTHAPSCTAFDLVGAEAGCAGRALTLVAPFDDVERSPEAARPVSAGPAAALRHLAELIADALPWPVPLAARDANMDLYPHQLSAALAFATGQARRVLVADAVGTGKTVQAGLAIAQVLANAGDARVLVAVPSALKPQWHRELRDRFAIDSRIVEAPVAAAFGTASESPWTTRGVAIASFDYVKRVDVLGGLDATWWHLLVIDEAHHGAGPTDRGEALRALAARALRVLMLTATPHDGDDGRFAALCAIGAHGPSDQLLRLARNPRGGEGARRRMHVLEVSVSHQEEEAGRLLERYLQALDARATGPQARALGLLAGVLRKRAASSPAALACSARRRRELLAIDPPAAQLALGFDGPAGPSQGDPDEEGDPWVLGVRIAADPRHERAWLGAIAESAARATHRCGKLRVLTRLLRRVREPVVVFTEYRDTMAWLHARLRATFCCDLLHGLQSPSERVAAIDAFVAGRTRVLLSTDAAAEGLNLHASCRVAVLFDLPWTPARVEQRIGRVDRVGQRNRVHAWALRTAADAPLVAHLEGRSARIARAALDEGGVDRRHDGGSAWHELAGGTEEAVAAQLARARAWRAAAGRHALAAHGRDSLPRSVDDRRSIVAWLPPSRLARLGAGGAKGLVLVQAVFAMGGELVLERTVWPVLLQLGEAWSGHTSRERRHDAARAAAQSAASAAAAAIEARRLRLQAAIDLARRTEASACEALAHALRSFVAAHFLQPGLFDAATPGPRTVHDAGLPACDGASPVGATVATPLVLLPRGWP